MQNKGSRNKGSTQTIKEVKISTTFNFYQLRDFGGGTNRSGDWFHTCMFKLP